MKPVAPSPARPVEYMLSAVRSAPKKAVELVVLFGEAEQYLPAWRLFTACAQDCQNRVGQHGQGSGTIPTVPVAHFVLVQPGQSHELTLLAKRVHFSCLTSRASLPVPEGRVGNSPGEA